MSNYSFVTYAGVERLGVGCDCEALIQQLFDLELCLNQALDGNQPYSDGSLPTDYVSEAMVAIGVQNWGQLCVAFKQVVGRLPVLAQTPGVNINAFYSRYPGALCMEQNGHGRVYEFSPATVARQGRLDGQTTARLRGDLGAPGVLFELLKLMCHPDAYTAVYGDSPILLASNGYVRAGLYRAASLMVAGPDFVDRHHLADWVAVQPAR